MDNSLKKEIFVWMNRNPQLIRNMNISEIAQKFYTTPSTVTKALQHFGYKGYKEFQKVIFSDLSINSSERNFIINNITKNIASALSGEKFIKSITDLFEKISQKNYIYLAGKGHSYMIVEYLKRLILMHFDKPVEIITDNYQVASMKEGLLIAVSLDKTSKIISDIEEHTKFTKVLITKIDPLFNRVNEDHFDFTIKIPSTKKIGEHHDNPVFTKAILELALSIYVNDKGAK